MKVNGKWYRAIWVENRTVCMIDQNLLPFRFKIKHCQTLDETCIAIKEMTVRGAGSIGAAGAYAMLQAIYESNNSELYEQLFEAKIKIDSTRPTAVNLSYATERVLKAASLSRDLAIQEALAIADECAEQGRLIGVHGNEIIPDGANIATHCNAGWLALVDYGSALAPIYQAYDYGKKVFVYVDETRPRLQGGRLTAWELKNHGVPHCIIPDNATAFLMVNNKIDLMIVGADRIAANGDTANKIGTLEKAIAARYFNIPFYVAAPTSTFDLKIISGKDIMIEQRNSEEVTHINGLSQDNQVIDNILITNPLSNAINPAFDVTPAELITGIITEKGIIKPEISEIKKLFNNESK